jgi:CRP-like cAMP-binding protein
MSQQAFRHDCLKYAPLFQGRDSSFLRCIQEELTVEIFKSGEMIMREGETGEQFYILHVGKVEVLSGPSQEVVATLESGSCFGEMTLLGVSNVRTSSIRALEFCDCRVIHFRSFWKILKRFPTERAYFDSLAQKRKLELVRKQEQQLIASSRDRSMSSAARSARWANKMVAAMTRTVASSKLQDGVDGAEDSSKFVAKFALALRAPRSGQSPLDNAEAQTTKDGTPPSTPGHLKPVSLFAADDPLATQTPSTPSTSAPRPPSGWALIPWPPLARSEDSGLELSETGFSRALTPLSTIPHAPDRPVSSRPDSHEEASSLEQQRHRTPRELHSKVSKCFRDWRRFHRQPCIPSLTPKTGVHSASLPVGFPPCSQLEAALTKMRSTSLPPSERRQDPDGGVLLPRLNTDSQMSARGPARSPRRPGVATRASGMATLLTDGNLGC